MPPYQFKREKGVVTADGKERVPNADERERLHGFKSGHTAAFEETRRISFMGNTFHCVAIAYLLATWAVGVKYLTVIPDIEEIWQVAKAEWPTRKNPVDEVRTLTYGGSAEEKDACATGYRFLGDPGVHTSPGRRVTVASPPDEFMAIQEAVHQDDPQAPLGSCLLYTSPSPRD